MLHILCALKCEAAPLLDHYRMVPVGTRGRIRIHADRETAISLTITGIGRRAADAAVRATREHYRAAVRHNWLNIGIAGHASLPLGTAVLAQSVRDGDGRCWETPANGLPGLPVRPLLTLDQESTAYTDELFDMEAAGIFSALDGCAPPAAGVHCLKVVSDNAHAPAARIPARQISDLIAGNLPVITELVHHLRHANGVTA